MAARVVHLVATGQVSADQVLGLTFTTKAAAELGPRVRRRWEAAGCGPRAASSRRTRSEVLEPTVATYNAYAAALLTEQGLRIGHEPDTRVMADASRYQLAARAIAQHSARWNGSARARSTRAATCSRLEGAMSEHLVSPEEVAGLPRGARLFEAELGDGTRARPTS